MKTIWVVEQGEYSDYRVVGVFSSKERAQLIADFVSGGGEVSEWSLDPAVRELNAGLSMYYVNMARDGSVLRSMRQESPYNLDLGVQGFPWVDHRNHQLGQYLAMMVWAKDDNHAIKIVNEKRTRLIAEDGWPKDVEA